MNDSATFDCIIIGAGAAGLMCAAAAGQRGRSVLVLEHANKVGKKILMSGGGRCNFTNLVVEPDNFLSANPHFCKSALSRYTQHDFLDLVDRYQLSYHEKARGQLFCDEKAMDILDILLAECASGGAKIQTHTSVETIAKAGDGAFELVTNKGAYRCHSLVIATGGLSIPTMGASDFGYRVARQFGLNTSSVLWASGCDRPRSSADGASMARSGANARSMASRSQARTRDVVESAEQLDVFADCEIGIE